MAVGSEDCLLSKGELVSDFSRVIKHHHCLQHTENEYESFREYITHSGKSLCLSYTTMAMVDLLSISFALPTSLYFLLSMFHVHHTVAKQGFALMGDNLSSLLEIEEKCIYVCSYTKNCQKRLCA